jgi:Fe-S oxidoreductase
VPSLAQRFDLYRCIQCGRCTGGCPVSITLGLNIRSLLYQCLTGSSVSGLLELPELWHCTTCTTCSARCPKGVVPWECLVGLREEIVERGKVLPTLREVLEATLKHGNPWGKPRAARAKWADGLNVPTAAGEHHLDWLYFAGCAASYDPRVQKVARALIRILALAHVSFGVLGERESCCGSEMRRLGEEGLFEVLAESNLEAVREAGCCRVMTTSPHCLNTLGQEYPSVAKELGLPYDWHVCHYSQVLDELVTSRRLEPGAPVGNVYVYHDPCFLGKQSGIYEEPRRVLTALRQVELREFERNRSRSLCCEGGGGRMWVEAGSGPRLAEQRVREAVELGADTLVTACPFCLLTLEDAAKTTGLEEKLRVLDLAEVVFESLDLAQAGG